MSNYVSCTIFYLREKERERTKSVCQDKLLALSRTTRLWIRHFIYDYTDTSRDPEMLHVNAYNLYNIRLMDEIGPFHHEPKQKFSIRIKHLDNQMNWLIKDGAWQIYQSRGEKPDIFVGKGKRLGISLCFYRLQRVDIQKFRFNQLYNRIYTVLWFDLWNANEISRLTS